MKTPKSAIQSMRSDLQQQRPHTCRSYNGQNSTVSVQTSSAGGVLSRSQCIRRQSHWWTWGGGGSWRSRRRAGRCRGWDCSCGWDSSGRSRSRGRWRLSRSLSGSRRWSCSLGSRCSRRWLPRWRGWSGTGGLSESGTGKESEKDQSDEALRGHCRSKIASFQRERVKPKTKKERKEEK